MLWLRQRTPPPVRQCKPIEGGGEGSVEFLKPNSSNGEARVYARRKSSFEGEQGETVKDGEISIISPPDVVLVLSSNSFYLEGESFLDLAAFEVSLSSQALGIPIVSSNRLGVQVGESSFALMLSEVNHSPVSFHN